ncbi:MAG TPA: PadR family transcriptional regulator [Gemmatimonadaceae bacterium]|nr:PadR family transcriptional regulator [Gemmatimonadaceae bacterium]
MPGRPNLRSRPLSPSAVAVLRAIAGGTRHGFDIMEATGLPSGTVYPVLGRLERGALVRSRWEAPGTAQREKRPPRRYYEISAAGERALAEAVEYYRTLAGGRRGGAPGGLAPKPQRS